MPLDASPYRIELACIGGVKLSGCCLSCLALCGRDSQLTALPLSLPVCARLDSNGRAA